jgi:hypothetical protein
LGILINTRKKSTSQFKTTKVLEWLSERPYTYAKEKNKKISLKQKKNFSTTSGSKSFLLIAFLSKQDREKTRVPRAVQTNAKYYKFKGRFYRKMNTIRINKK